MRGSAIASVVLLGIASMVALGRLHPYGNPRSEYRYGLGTPLQNLSLSPSARSVFVNKCADCHSNETRWPVYARVAPASWLVERDVAVGREHLNLSYWNELPPDRRLLLSAKIVQEARSGEMPPVQYRLIHRGSALTAEDVAILAQMTRPAAGSETKSSQIGGAGDAVRGKALFDRRCSGCHAMAADREGPRLAGVFGRKAGSVSGFKYSAGLKKSGVTWDEAMLETWLSDPDVMVPDNKMSFRVPKAQERLDLIAFLKQ